MNKQDKFDDYMNNVFAPWVLQMVIFANVFGRWMMFTDAVGNR